MLEIARSMLDQLRRRQRTKLRWLHCEHQEGVIQFGDWRFHVRVSDAMADPPSSARDFVVLKTPPMIEQIAALADNLRPRNVLELGIFKGGSVALYNELFKPEKLVAIDLSPTAIPQLSEYIRRCAAESSVSPYWGVNQADRTRLAQICAREFGNRPLDLVIDDASHFLFETRESFRELFPRLRPGGVYVIEDWGWAHWPGELWQCQGGGDYFRGKEPMTTLVIELVILSASRATLIREVCVRSATVYVTRGEERVDPGFEPSDFCLNRGNPLPRFVDGERR